MITRRPADERGHANHGWLDTYHSFSFGEYLDPQQMGFRALRVINEDFVEPSRGFGMHPHADMEILTVVLEGALEHRDSLGNGSVIRPGDIQRMTAGTGIRHSEFNPSDEERVHLLQIWILPETRGLTPSYAEATFPAEERRGRLRLLASREGREGSVSMNRDVDLLGAVLEPGEAVTHDLRPGRFAWIQVARGAIDVNGTKLEAGDGAAVEAEERLEIRAESPSEVLLFDLD
jgi:redox-sensitive bicupin YhaK (pirin superfamily)